MIRRTPTSSIGSSDAPAVLQPGHLASRPSGSRDPGADDEDPVGVVVGLEGLGQVESVVLDGTKDFIKKNKTETRPRPAEEIPDFETGQDSRTHLLAARLGRSNTDPRNFVSMHAYANSPTHRDDFEREIYKAVMKDGQTVEYRVTPIYGHKDSRPCAMIIEATGSGPKPLIIRDVIFNEPFRR